MVILWTETGVTGVKAESWLRQGGGILFTTLYKQEEKRKKNVLREEIVTELVLKSRVVANCVAYVNILGQSHIHNKFIYLHVENC